jgi:hypothetical protein
MMPPAALQLLSALLEVGPEGAPRQHLVAKAGIVTSTFYRILKPLMQNGLIVQVGDRYHLPLGNLHNFRFKLWHDASQLYQLAPPDRGAILDILAHARHHLGDNLKVLWLVGSAASDTLTADSDLDFLALVGEETLYHPASQRPVNFVVMTQVGFDAERAQGDDFVLAALRSGLVLFDGGTAQAIYEKAPTIALSIDQRHQAEAGIERQHKRLFHFVEAKAGDESRRALQAMAIKTAWFMLRSMNVAPPPKNRLVPLCEEYFGPRFATLLRQAIGKQAIPVSKQLSLSRDLEETHTRFTQALSHLQAYAALPYAGALPLRQLCAQIFHEWLPTDSSRYLVECKASNRLDMKTIQSLARTASRLHPTPHPVLVANVDRKIPVLDRPQPPFPDDVLKAAHTQGVVLLTGLDLLRAHNRQHLDERRVDQVLHDLLGPARRTRSKAT